MFPSQGLASTQLGSQHRKTTAVLCSAVSRTPWFLPLSRNPDASLTSSHQADDLHSHGHCFQKKKEMIEGGLEYMLALSAECLVPSQGTLNTTLTLACTASSTHGPLDTCDPSATSGPWEQERDIRPYGLILREAPLSMAHHIQVPTEALGFLSPQQSSSHHQAPPTNS